MFNQFELLSMLLVPVGAYVVGALVIALIEVIKGQAELPTQPQDGQ